MAGFGNSTPNKNKQKISKNGLQLLEAAIRAHKIGDITNAEALYLNAINSGFHHEIAFSNLGVIYKNTGREEKAIATYERAIAKKPNFADAYTNLGNLYKDLGNLDQALTSTLKSLELKPDNPDAHINLGSIHKDLGNLDQALTSTLKSLELKPDNPTAHMNLGAIYSKLRIHKSALNATLKSIEIQPDNHNAYVNLSEIYNRINDTTKAIESINHAIKLDTQNANAHLLNGRISLETGNSTKAEQSLLKSIELNDKLPASHRYLSIALYLKGDYEASIKSIENAIAIDANCNLNKEVEAILRGKIKGAKSEPTSGTKHKSTRNQSLHFPITLKRPVEKGLINTLYELEHLDLEKRNLPTKGNAKTSDFSFFKHNKKLMHFVEQDLIFLAQEAIGTDVYFTDSWFTILSGGGLVDKHNHISDLSKIKQFVDQAKHYALVYYLDIGDQSSKEPGHLKFYDPEDLILPSEGMVIIFPADRYHSVRYSGSKDRLMIGANLWSI
jgi:tetratricopeptide (TPR) repeat protein